MSLSRGVLAASSLTMMSVKAFAATVTGDIDIVISNAGINVSGPEPPWEMDTVKFQQVMNVNVLGTFLVTKYFGKILAAQAKIKGAPLKKIINMSSGIAHSTTHIQAAYAASKWAVEAFSKSTAQSIRAWGLDGRMMCVPLAPGVVKTEMNPESHAHPLEKWSPQAADAILNMESSQTGASLTMASRGFYSDQYIKTWVIPDGMPLPCEVVQPK